MEAYDFGEFLSPLRSGRTVWLDAFLSIHSEGRSQFHRNFVRALKSVYGFKSVYFLSARRAASASSTILWPFGVSRTRVHFLWLGSGNVSTSPSRAKALQVRLVLDWPSKNSDRSSCIFAIPEGCRARNTKTASECTGRRLPAPLLSPRRNASKVLCRTRRSSTASGEGRRISGTNTTSNSGL